MSDPLTIIHGDALSSLQAMEGESVQCVVTSPPYWGLRDYGHEWQIGLEKTPEQYVERLVEIFGDVRRVLRNDGTAWLNIGDSYAAGKSGRDDSGNNGRFGGPRIEPQQRKAPAGLKPKDLVGIPWMVAFALRADGWYLRSDIIWSKPNPMPESVTDRPTKSHEYIFLLSKSERYYYDAQAIAEPSTVEPHARGGTHQALGGPMDRGGHSQYDAAQQSRVWGNVLRNRRSVWTVTTQPFSGAHFATFPPDLIKPCILAGAPIGGVVLDPFAGSGTTGKVAIELGRKSILIEPKAEYVQMIEKRCRTTIGLPL